MTLWSKSHLGEVPFLAGAAHQVEWSRSSFGRAGQGEQVGPSKSSREHWGGVHDFS